MSEPEWAWLSTEAIIDLHAEQLEEHGGAAGLRDEGGLQAAMARPRQVAAYDPRATTAFRLAAAYAQGLTRNHPFTDGNKRMAFLAAVAFLDLNGWYLDALEQDAERLTLALSARDIDEAEFAAWLERHCLPR